MYSGTNFTCDICQKQFNGQDSVRNVISIENGAGAKNFPMVCDKCAKKVIEAVEELKPQTKQDE